MQLVYYANSLTLWIHLKQRLLSQYYTHCAKLFFCLKKKKKSQNYPQKTVLRSCQTDKNVWPKNILLGEWKVKRISYSYFHNQFLYYKGSDPSARVLNPRSFGLHHNTQNFHQPFLRSVLNIPCQMERIKCKYQLQSMS